MGSCVEGRLPGLREELKEATFDWWERGRGVARCHCMVD